MSAGVSDQRMKGQGNQVSNVPKEHLESGGEDFESWRHQPPTTHTPYVPISTTTDPYNPTGAYYGSTTAFPYQAFGVNDGTWSNGTDPMTFLGGYSHDTYGVDASAFGQPSTFNFFPGNSDYSTWGTHTHNQQRKAHYEEYYRADQQAQNMYTGYTNTTNIGMPDSTLGLKTMEKDMQNLGLDMSSQMLPGQTMGQMSVANLSSCGQNEKELGLKVQDQKENLGLNHPPPSLSSSSSAPKKMTWASIASQPAKPQVSSTSTGLKKKGPGMPPPPMVPGKHNMDIGTWDTAKNGPSAVVNNSQPHPQQPTPKTSPEVSSPGNVRPSWVGGPMRVQTQPSVITTRAPLVVPAIPTHHSLMHFSTQQVQHQQQQQQQGPYAGNNLPVMLPHMAHSAMSVPPPGALGLHGVQGGTMLIPQLPLQPNHPVLDELKGKNNYNPLDFDMNTTSKARFFVIKSYSEDDIHRSIKYEIWCSTEHGNKRLDQAFREREKEGSGGSVFLFFSVNGSGHFCGMAQMVSAVDYNSNSSVWSQNKWKGQFRVRWIYVKDVPNVQLRHIRLENNENKPVTNSRDTQEVPQPKGQQVLRILHSYPHSTSIFDDFVHYEKRQEEEDSRKGPAQEMFESAKLQHGHEYEGSGGAGKGHQYQHHNQGGPLNKIHHGGGGGGGGFRGGEHYHEPTNQRGHPNPNDPNQYREARSGSNREQDGPGHRGTHNMHQKERGESGGRGRGRARN